MSLPSVDQPFVIGSISTLMGAAVPVVTTKLSTKDLIGTLRVKWRIGRSNYKVDPGLYAVGCPDSSSSVLVTANYKLSFDSLRSNLVGFDAWLLVLDTDGVNVWCAAGKGSFGSEELANRIGFSGLPILVKHRRLVLPQLGAPGISAHKIKQLTGFRVIYGPVNASDLPSFLKNAMKASGSDRQKTFTLLERIELIPVELVASLGKWGYLSVGLLMFSGILGPDSFLKNVYLLGLPACIAMLAAIITGAVLFPPLLPYLPGRAFAAKGLVLGWGTSAAWFAISQPVGLLAPILNYFGIAFIITAVVTYLGMNFTGAATYTSLSGVRHEMRWALPLEIVTGAVGLLLWAISLTLM